jgi:hypothetical protein
LASILFANRAGNYRSLLKLFYTLLVTCERSMVSAMLSALLHASLVGVASILASRGGWVFGKGVFRKGLLFGAMGMALFLVDDFIFGR